MINQDYLKYLAKAASVEEFLLKYTIISGNDISANIAMYEKDYCNRIKKCKFYAKRFIKDGKISFEDCINSKLPIIINARIVRDQQSYEDVYQINFYNSKGEKSNVNVNLTLLKDMKAIHNIDTDSEIEYILQYELENLK